MSRETSVAYRRGWNAYEAGRPNSENPFPSEPGKSANRNSWYEGWYDNWRITKWGPNEGEEIIK